jgi:hypothetical protein
MNIHNITHPMAESYLKAFCRKAREDDHYRRITELAVDHPVGHYTMLFDQIKTTRGTLGWKWVGPLWRLRRELHNNRLGQSMLEQLDDEDFDPTEDVERSLSDAKHCEELMGSGGDETVIPNGCRKPVNTRGRSRFRWVRHLSDEARGHYGLLACTPLNDQVVRKFMRERLEQIPNVRRCDYSRLLEGAVKQYYIVPEDVLQDARVNNSRCVVLRREEAQRELRSRVDWTPWFWGSGLFGWYKAVYTPYPNA